MIDLHSHIVYAIDDGVQSLDEALALGRMAAADGTRVIAATPHSPGSTACRSYDPALIRERVAEINAALQAEQTALEVVVGTEICFGGDIVDRLKHGALLPYDGSRSILVELPYNTIPATLDTVLFALQVAGYRVVLAHPERIIEVQRDPNRLLPLIERGVLMQLTAEALTGAQGERLRTTAETLLTHGMAHVLASDAHGTPPRRPPLLATARARAAELIGQEAADALVTTIPTALLNDQPPPIPDPRPVVQQRRFWWHG